MSGLCVLIALFISGHGITCLYSQEKSSGSSQEAGQIVEIKCSGFLKKAGSATEDTLDPKQDNGRKLYAGDAVKCVGEGQMKIEVYKRSHEINQTHLWYPIPEPANSGGGSGAGRVGHLRGTYQLDLQQTYGSNTAALDLPSAWQAALTTPHVMAIDLNGDTVTIASSAFSKFAFKADGSVHKFLTGDGEMIRTIARFDGGRLIINSSTDRNRSLEAILSPQRDGALKLTSKLSFGGKREPAVMRATYQRTSLEAQLDEFLPGAASGAASAHEAAPSIILAAFDDDLSTDSATAGSVITLTVQEPARYRGAQVQARVLHVGRPGNAQIALSFESLNLPPGRSHRLLAPKQAQAVIGEANSDQQTGKIIAGQTSAGIAVAESNYGAIKAPGAVYWSPLPVFTLKKGTVILIRNASY